MQEGHAPSSRKATVGRRLGILVAAAAAVVFALPGIAHAASSTFSDTVSDSGWKSHPTVYTATATSNGFDPNGLICPDQSGTGCYLAVRLVNLGGFVISPTVQWFDNYNFKN